MTTSRTVAPVDRETATGAGRGYVAALGAYGLWGLSPAFWPLLAPAGATEILAHRVAWTLVGMLVVLTVAGGWSALRGLSARTWAAVTAGSVLIAINWGVFIGATLQGRVVEAALGYYVNPLVSVLLGVVVLHERLRRAQWLALGTACVAVVVLTVQAGTPPWITLILAASFGLYGLVKKKVPLDPVPGMTAESFLLGPIAIVYVVVLGVLGTGTFTGLGAGHALLLVASGPATALPLLLFAAGARRLPLITLGLLQYVNPTIQFLYGVLVVHDPIPPLRWVGIGLIWVALLLLATDALRARRPAPEPTYCPP